MIPPPKYTRTAEEGPINQHHHINSFIDDENDKIDAPPPPAYSSQANRAPSSQDAQHGSEEGSIRNDWPLAPPVPSPSQPQQAHPPATRRGNPFVADVRAWNAFQVVNLNSSNRAPRVGSSRALRTVLTRAPRYRTRGDVENGGRPLRDPKFTRKFLCVLQFMFCLRGEDTSFFERAEN
jgi:hypothetical protein